ncbi:hypothetical protein PCASD_16896 [Puccinia coronata f. sp. avenae]|uniref:Uncharacterized protein n=1 Tax=Puccinia coronata f. sp. avenae TaxID=200324 RepID=A0A2N5SUZ8_9BASI|nr:hypothetical protein PCASD_16896 [Puccinia coronata f. sp. avenae]
MDNIPVSDYDNSATQGLLITLRNEHLASSDAMFGLSELDSDLRALGTETVLVRESRSAVHHRVLVRPASHQHGLDLGGRVS